MPPLSSSVRPSPLVSNLLIGLLCLIWGSTWVVIKKGLIDLPPFTAAGARFAVAATVMTLVAFLLRHREGGSSPPLLLSIAMGTCNFAISYGIVYWAETILPSGLVAVLWGIFPLLQAFAGHIFLPAERQRSLQWGGFVLGLLGVLLFFFTDLKGITDAIPAAMILFLSPAISVVGNTLVKKYGERSSSVLLNRDGMIVGAVLLISFAFWRERDIQVAWSRLAIFSVFYLGIAGTVVTFGLYYWLLRYQPAHKLSLIAYVTPVVALTLGWLIGGEKVTMFTITGTLAILGGVALVVRRPRG